MWNTVSARKSVLCMVSPLPCYVVAEKLNLNERLMVFRFYVVTESGCFVLEKLPLTLLFTVPDLSSLKPSHSCKSVIAICRST